MSGLAEFVESLTGNDVVAIERCFGCLIEDLEATGFAEALIFVNLRRAGIDEHVAYRTVITMPESTICRRTLVLDRIRRKVDR